MIDPFRKTRTAAGYLLLHGNGDADRYQKLHRLFASLQTCDRALATGDPKPDDAVADLLSATVELAGQSWLRANASDIDVMSLTTALQQGWRNHRAYHHAHGHRGGTGSSYAAEPDIAELDDLLSRVLWARYAPP